MGQLRAAFVTLITAAIVAGAWIAAVTPSARGAYLPNTWHITTPLLSHTSTAPGTTSTIFTVPQGVDLTITDIVYEVDFRITNQLGLAFPPFSAALPVQEVGWRKEYGIQARVYDGGPNSNPVGQPNANPTNYSQSPQVVSDTATFNFWQDRFRPTRVSIAELPEPVDEGMQVWWTYNPLGGIFGAPFTPYEPTYNAAPPDWTFAHEAEGVDELEFLFGINGTESHHFQTGLVIPSGNDLKVDAMVRAQLSRWAITGYDGSCGVTVHLSGVLQ